MPAPHDADLHARLKSETARIRWAELVPHFARGVVVHVGEALDLVEVAAAFVENRRDDVDAWLQEGAVALAGDDDARRWTENDAMLRAVVVAPWVLVQAIE